MFSNVVITLAAQTIDVYLVYLLGEFLKCVCVCLAKLELDVMASCSLLPCADTEQLLASTTSFFDKWRVPFKPLGTCSLWQDLMHKVRCSRNALVPFVPPTFDRDAFLQTIANISAMHEDEARLDSTVARQERREAAKIADPLLTMKAGMLLLMYAKPDYVHFLLCPVYMGKVLEWNAETQVMKVHWFKRFKVSSPWNKSGWELQFAKSNKRSPSIDLALKYDENSICLFGFELKADGHMKAEDLRLADTRLQEHLLQIAEEEAQQESQSNSDSDASVQEAVAVTT